MRIDLGDLELYNKTSIAEALVVRFNEYRNYLMTNDQAMNAHIGFQKSNGKEVTREQVIKECEQENAQCEKAMQEFANEENRYLEKYLEFKQINEQTADVFLYYCKETDFDKVPKTIDAQLENIYEKFNCNRPKDFQGHSLSVSDIVAVDRQLYYCKDIGFEKMKLVKGKENDVLVSAAQQEKQRPKKRSLRVELSNGKGCERERDLEKL